jgi:hypothetical protein
LGLVSSTLLFMLRFVVVVGKTSDVSSVFLLEAMK